ncbi:MAG TPA: hypothetical protein VN456_06635 [Desulfosporosinus sp.]|nr:hypothetical protein [Desulfosporosinus sp.]
MGEKLAITLNMGKKKVAAIALAAALMLSFSTLTAFAASHLESLQVAIDGDGERYSTDGGQTWSNQVPDGATVSVGENGEQTIFIGTPPKGAIDDINAAVNAATGAVADDNIAVKQEDSKFLYSTDGGQTWSENAPDGVVIDAE